MQTLIESSKHGGTSGDHNGVEEVLAHINVAALDRVEDHLVDAGPLETNLVRAEENLGSLILLRTKRNDAAVGQMIVRSVPILALTFSHVHIVTNGHRDIALELLNLLDDLKLGRRVEHIALSAEQQLQVLRHVSTANIDTLNSIVDSVALVDGRAVAAAVTGIEHQASRVTTRIQTQDSLLLEEDLRRAELLKEDVGRLSSIVVRVERRLSEKDGMLLRRDLQLVEYVAPKLLHIIPVSDDTVLDGIVQFENTLELVSSLTNERVLLILRDHDLLVNGSTNTTYAKYLVTIWEGCFQCHFTYVELNTRDGSVPPPMPAFIIPEPY